MCLETIILLKMACQYSGQTDTDTHTHTHTHTCVHTYTFIRMHTHPHSVDIQIDRYIHRSSDRYIALSFVTFL